MCTFDAILTVTMDRFTKMAHFIPCTKTTNSEETTNMVTRELFQRRGLPNDIIRDYEPQCIFKILETLDGNLESLM